MRLREKGGSGPYTSKLPSSISPTFSLVLRPTIPAPAKNAVNVAIRAKKPSVVVGSPKLTLRYKGTSKNTKVRVLAQLVDPKTGLVLGNQITPFALKLNGKRHTQDVAMEDVSFALRKGQRLQLQIVANSGAYKTFPKGGRVTFSKVRIGLPVVSSS